MASSRESEERTFKLDVVSVLSAAIDQKIKRYAETLNSCRQKVISSPKLWQILLRGYQNSECLADCSLGLQGSCGLVLLLITRSSAITGYHNSYGFIQRSKQMLFLL